jgi:hypothetical protein
MNTIPINDIYPNPRNPRQIKDGRFNALRKSLSDFPQMMELRPIIVDADGMILGGNMRWRALKENGLTEIPAAWVKRADELSAEDKRRFIVMDNETFGQTDYDILSADFELPELEDWGVDLPEDVAGDDEGEAPEEQGPSGESKVCPHCGGAI